MLLSALLGSKVAAAALSTALVATGGAALAVNVSAEVEAADTVETPDVTSTPTPEVTEPSDEPTETESPEAEATKGPDATGPAAYGLCTAWGNGALSEEKAAAGNAPSQNLIDAAGGAGNVEAYCADVVTAKDEAKGKPSASSDKGKPDKDKGKPSSAPEDDADEPDAETSPEVDEPTAPEESASVTTKPGKGSGQKNKG